MIILGVDPGTLITGYGLVESTNGKMSIIASGAITNISSNPMPRRLQTIFEELSRLIQEFHPTEFAVETSFYGKNAQSALKLGQARGVVLVTATSNRLPISEYSPREVKKAIVGSGTASKEQVQYMVKTMLKMRSIPKYFDITDALAVAICHIHRRGAKSSKATFRTWKSFITAHPEKVKSLAR